MVVDGDCVVVVDATNSNFDAFVPTDDLRLFFTGVVDSDFSDIAGDDAEPERILPLVRLPFPAVAPPPPPPPLVEFVDVVVVGVLRRFDEALVVEDFEGGVAFPAEKTGDDDGVDFAAALLPPPPPPPTFRDSCHALARAVASARSSFLLFFGVELSTPPPPPPVGEVSAFRLGMLNGTDLISIDCLWFWFVV